MNMKTVWRFLCCISVIMMLLFVFLDDTYANTLFKGRQIYLSKNDNRVFRIGITGTTAGHNYLALIENAQQESISLGDLGYWERVEDPPSFLRNYDLQFIVKNNYKGKFQIEFEYNEKSQSIDYRIKEGKIKVDLDDNNYYPALIIGSIASAPRGIDEGLIEKGLNNFLFFDFNSFDVDLRRYYGNIKRLLTETDSSHYFYYYEAGDYNSYYFKTYQDVSKLDTDKMGLSLEDGTLEYYQKILDNLKSRFGTEFADRVIIVSRFGNKYYKELKKYAYEIGLSEEMVVSFWSYDDLNSFNRINAGPRPAP